MALHLYSTPNYTMVYIMVYTKNKTVHLYLPCYLEYLPHGIKKKQKTIVSWYMSKKHGIIFNKYTCAIVKAIALIWY